VHAACHRLRLRRSDATRRKGRAGFQAIADRGGLGFAAAIFVDAYIIRTVLVPSVMHMLGRANWWLPAWLDRLLPRLHVEPAELTSAGLLRQPAGVGPREQ
jgi:uncharacterized membrane protein YdfJ with MMPL/SSD domain